MYQRTPPTVQCCIVVDKYVFTSVLLSLALLCSLTLLYSRGLKHAARQSISRGPRCFSGIFKYLTFVLPSVLKKDAAK